MDEDSLAPILSIVGSACFIDQWRYMVASPLARLTVDGVGVRVGVERRWYGIFMKRGIWFGLRPLRHVGKWEAAWDTIVGVRVAGDTIVLENAERERCRFVSQDPCAVTFLVEQFRRRSIRLRAVRSAAWDISLDRHWDR